MPIELGLAALNDRSRQVRYRACGLLAYALRKEALPSLQSAAGAANVKENKPRTGAEDFGFFAEKIPCFYFFLGGMPKGGDEKTAPGHHTPDFFVDESGMKLGVKSFCHLVLDYFAKGK